MKKFISPTLACVLSIALLFTASAFAAPVFKVSKDGESVFIGGTFHLLTEGDYPLPDAFEKAYQQADALYFETDIQALETPEFQRKSLGVLLYQDGSTLKTGLDEATYARFVDYAQSRQLDPMQLNGLNPTGVMLTITIMEYQARGFVAQGVDKFYFDKAQADNKTIGWFETPEQQLALIDSFDDGEPNALINYTLDEIENFDAIVKPLHESWRSGDMETLTSLGIDSFDGYPEVYDVMLAQRNNSWMPKIEAMFSEQGTEFVLVGALHLPGEDGVLTQLKNKGYTVEKL